MSCEERRQIYRLFIERMEVFPEEKTDGRILKSISFRFSVSYGKDGLTPEGNIENDIRFTLDRSETELTAAEAKATYAEIKKYIKDTFGANVYTLYIAQIKRKYSLDMGKKYNLAADPKKKVPKCPKDKMKKCYQYMRVSTTMQVEGYSIEAQKDRLTKYADFQHTEIVREYCDAGESGKNITGRPEFSQMLQDVADDRDVVDYILVFKLSRFGRNAADVLNSLQYIQDFGVNLICVEDGIDLSKDSGKLTITVLSSVAEIERENILVQTMEGRKQKAREGKI